jgi:hypothetical protein
MPREQEAIILSFNTILQALRNTLPDEKVDSQEVKILDKEDEKWKRIRH